MNRQPSFTRYNQRIPHMRARTSSGLRLGWLTSFLLATVFLPSSLCASGLGDTARQLAYKIAAAAGPGAAAILYASWRAVSPRPEAHKEDGRKTVASKNEVSQPSRRPLDVRARMCGMR